MTPAIPNVIKKMKTSELNALYSFLTTANIGPLSKFAQTCLKEVKDRHADTVPVGTNVDYYNWGLRKGVMNAHEMYGNLLNLVKAEKDARKKDAAIDENGTNE